MIIVGIDPGSRFMGVAVGDLIVKDKKISLIKSFAADLEKIAASDVHGARYTAAFNILDKLILNYVDRFTNIFMEGGVMMSRGGQSQVTTHEGRAPVKMWVWQKIHRDIFPIAPTEFKKRLGIKGNADKAQVHARVSELFPDTKFTQDEADAIGIMWAGATLLIENTHI